MSRITTFALVLAGLAGTAGGAAAQDAAAGEKVFNKCKACHAVGEGATNKVGPYLNGIVGRKAASIEGYAYSPALKALADGGLVWTEDKLRPYLTDPKAFNPGTKMAFVGLKKEDELANVIAYLKTFGADGKKQ